MKLHEGIDKKVRYELDSTVKENGVLLLRLVALSSKGSVKHITFTEIPVKEASNMDIAFNLLSHKRILIRSHLTSENVQKVGGFLNALRNLECLQFTGDHSNEP